MTLTNLLTSAARAMGLSLLCSLAAQAAYFKWETIQLPASSGASCGNGSPYRFFVNRTPFSTKTVVMFEGGGACWEKGTCENKAGTLLNAVNPDGIPSNYMSDFNRQAHLGLVTPFTARIHPLTSVQTQSWNIVYATYCTGDVHAGNKVTTYSDEAGSTAWYHRGAVNAKAITNWMAANMRKPVVLGHMMHNRQRVVRLVVFRQVGDSAKNGRMAQVVKVGIVDDSGYGVEGNLVFHDCADNVLFQ